MDRRDRETLDASYRELVGFYFQVKELVAASETEDSEQRLSLSAISELRAAIDHVMRAHNVLYGLVQENDIATQTGLPAVEYCGKNYDKARGHLYRAGYDAYDIIIISLVQEIRRMLRCLSLSALYAVIPDAAESVMAPLEEGRSLAVQAKMKKDIESTSQERQQFLACEQAAKRLYDVKHLLDQKGKALIDFEKAHRKERLKERVINLLLGAIVGAGITAAATLLL